jgi:hypothetical protein
MRIKRFNESFDPEYIQIEVDKDSILNSLTH